jgi:RND family efflux transporter MFP subunit
MKPQLLVVIAVSVVVAGTLGFLWGQRGSQGFRQSAQGPEPGRAIGSSASGRRILYYRNAMGLPDTSPVPKKDPMGMDYVPVYEGEQPGSGQVHIDSAKLQTLGVRTEPVSRRSLTRTLRIVGNLQASERNQSTVSAKFEGWITRLYVDTTGATVARGQPLLEVYSPDLLSAEQDYRVAVKAFKALQNADPESQASMQALVDSSLARLRNWDIAESDLAGLREGKPPSQNLVLRAQHTGVVTEKTAKPGMRFMPGDALYQIADISAVWLVGSVFEQDVALVHVGDRVAAAVVAYPGRTFAGAISFVAPVLQSETRTAQIRVELPNPQGLLKPAMYGAVELVVQLPGERLVVPNSAILDSGTRQLVLVDRGGGSFEPRQVRLGLEGSGYTEILDGVNERDAVVVNGNFLIDAESNLKAALGGLAHGHGTSPPAQPKDSAGSGSTQPQDHSGH